MQVALIGCEYVGKTTLAGEISRWWTEQVGVHGGSFHDHFVVPELVHKNPPESDEEEAQIATMTPSLLEKYQRYNILYHMGGGKNDEHWLVDWFYADAVYAPMYYGYDRSRWTRRFEIEMMERCPNVAVVLMKASPEVIRRRMQEHPHPKGLVKPGDVEEVLARFDEEYRVSANGRRFILDTTNATIQETLADFVRQMERMLTDKDRLRINAHAALRQGGSV